MSRIVWRDNTRIMKAGEVTRLSPDAKARYGAVQRRQPVRITKVVHSTSTPLTPAQDHPRLHHQELIEGSLPDELLDRKTEYLINPNGRFVKGGGGHASRHWVTGRRSLWTLTAEWAARRGASAAKNLQCDRSALTGPILSKNIVASAWRRALRSISLTRSAYPDRVGGGRYVCTG